MKRPQHIFLCALALALVLTGTACTTVEQRSTAAQQLNAVWTTENQATRARMGARNLTATPDQVRRALRVALPNIGFDLDEQASDPAGVTAKALFAQGSFSWSPEIRAQEEKRMREVFVSAIGKQGLALTVKPQAEVITATGRIASVNATSARLSLDFRSSTPGAAGASACTMGACLDEIPPSALAAAYYQFWSAFEPALDEVRQADAAKATAANRRRPAPAAPRKPPVAKRPPSDWVLPPSGWKPPK